MSPKKRLHWAEVKKPLGLSPMVAVNPLNIVGLVNGKSSVDSTQSVKVSPSESRVGSKHGSLHRVVSRAVQSALQPSAPGPNPSVTQSALPTLIPSQTSRASMTPSPQWAGRQVERQASGLVSEFSAPSSHPSKSESSVSRSRRIIPSPQIAF